jgi:TRAP-type mannitol/chloroaromatic compound transport system substrate-binding protein
MLAEYTARNPAALKTLVEKHKVDIRVYPNDVLLGRRRKTIVRRPGLERARHFWTGT